MSDILTREKVLQYLWRAKSGILDNALSDALDRHDAALRACIQQAVLDVEKLPHVSDCRARFNFLPSIDLPCSPDCGHDAAIANLKKGLGEKS